MAKVTSEEWEQYLGLEFYPDRFCECGCGGKIPIQKHHRYHGIPKYIYGHHSVGKNNPMYGKKHSLETRRKIAANVNKALATEEVKQKIKDTNASKETKARRRAANFRRWADLENRKKTIATMKKVANSPETKKKIKESNSKPEVKARRKAAAKKVWENPVRRTQQSIFMKKFWENSPEMREVQSKMMIKQWKDLEFRINHILKTTGQKRSDLAKENIRAGLGRTYAGPDWWLSFRDFVKSACYLYKIQYMRASISIRRELEKKGVNRFDILIFLNWSVGHNQFELAEHYNITADEVKKILKKLYKIYPHVFQEGTSAPICPSLSLDDWMLAVKDF